AWYAPDDSPAARGATDGAVTPSATVVAAPAASAPIEVVDKAGVSFRLLSVSVTWAAATAEVLVMAALTANGCPGSTVAGCDCASASAVGLGSVPVPSAITPTMVQKPGWPGSAP